MRAPSEQKKDTNKYFINEALLMENRQHRLLFIFEPELE